MPPEAPDHKTGSTPPAVSLCLATMKTRAQYLAAARAKRLPMASMLLQARDRGDNEACINIGFTCSKKVGNAVLRNRAKRRLRAVAYEVIGKAGKPGWDYVLVGRHGATVEAPFDDLKRDLTSALQRVHEA